MTVVSSWGCLVLSGERRLGRLITGHEGSPPRSVPNLAHRRDQGTFSSSQPWLRAEASRGGVANWAMAQMKPTISRAMAVVATTFGLPAAIRCR